MEIINIAHSLYIVRFRKKRFKQQSTAMLNESRDNDDKNFKAFFTYKCTTEQMLANQ